MCSPVYGSKSLEVEPSPLSDDSHSLHRNAAEVPEPISVMMTYTVSATVTPFFLRLSVSCPSNRQRT